MFTEKQIWESCLAEIESQVSKANFSTWFKNTFIAKEDAGTAYIGVPNEFVKDWLFNKYHKLILKTLMNYNDAVRGVEFIISKGGHQRQNEPTIDTKDDGPTRELPFQTSFINKEDNLNPRYTFSTFVVGSFNQLAYSAAQAVVARPGASYNPFFVYGSTGLGKTHLIQSIGNMIKEKHPDKKIYYTTLEKFSFDLVNALQASKGSTFKEKYHKYDVIVMDDIQFITGKQKTQEELFHLFNTFYDSNKQIIFSSDKHPNHIQGLEDRMRSRLGAGMIIDINEPEYESKVAIIRSKLEEQGITLQNELIDFLASSVHGSIRELEGSLNAIMFQVKQKQRELTLIEVKNLVKNNLKPKKNVSIKDVVKIIADYYNVDENIIYEKTRRKEIVHARQMIMYILREDFNVSYPLIGQKLGGKDHTTVIHSFLKIKEDLKKNQETVTDLEQLRLLFK